MPWTENPVRDWLRLALRCAECVIGISMLAACQGESDGVRTESPSSCPFAPPAGMRLESACGSASWTAGSTELCSGRLVYRDHVYDDHGAEGPIPRTRWNPNSSNAFVTPTGDDAYPAGAENTADLVRFEMRLEGDRMEVEFELNTLYRADQTMAVVLLDSDNDVASGGGAWVDPVSGASFNTASSGWDEIHVLRDADPATNRITGDFPAPAGAAWKVWGAVAQADGTVMNLAFRADETSAGNWFDQKQATALAAGDVTQFSAGVCPAEMRARLTRGAPARKGLRERVYTSAYTLPPGEGLSIDGVTRPGFQKDASDPRVYQAFNFLGRYQPYAYYLPEGTGPHGMQVILHGFSQTHVANVDDAGVQSAFAEDLNRVLVSPLGRGLAGAYSDISERDVLDVLDDALEAFNIDRSRVIMSGISMGGYGQLALGTQYPDRFAGLIGWVSPTGNFETYSNGEPPTYVAASLAANTARLVRNLRHVPVLLRYGELDEFVLKAESDRMLDYMIGTVAGEAADEGPFDFDKVLNADHVTTFDTDHAIEAGISKDWRRPDRVARVTYRMDPRLDVPAYSITHDRAYWVSGIAPRDPERYADVDLTSLGCGRPVAETQDGTETGTAPPFVWERTFRRVARTSGSVSNHIEGSIANVAVLTIDVTGACLGASALGYELETDGPTEVTLSDGRRITLDSAGTHTGTL